jgi:hypothetical protein
MSDDSPRRTPPPAPEPPIRREEPPPPTPLVAEEEPPAVVDQAGIIDTRPSTLLPPWPDELVVAPLKGAALGWVDRQPIPLRYKRSLIFAWSRYTGVSLTSLDIGALIDPQTLPPTP